MISGDKLSLSEQKQNRNFISIPYAFLSFLYPQPVEAASHQSLQSSDCRDFSFSTIESLLYGTRHFEANVVLIWCCINKTESKLN